MRFDEPLAPWTTIRLGGSAAQFVEADSEELLIELLGRAAAEATPVFILGGGSNVVVSDQGWPGLVLRVALPGIQVARAEGHVRLVVAAGEPLDALVERCVSEGWAGMECLAGIPGLVGATPIQNVGAYGQEVADTIVQVRAFDRHTQQFVVMSPMDCGFGYRSSMFRGRDQYVVTSVVFELAATEHSKPIRYAELARALGIQSGSAAPLKSVREAVLSLRRSKGMVWDLADPESISAGSFFVNPVLGAGERDALDTRLRACGMMHGDEQLPGHQGEAGWKMPAAWLIERAGFPKGTTRGLVGVSSKHALALVNRGGTTRELLAFAEEIREAVWTRFGVRLEREPIVVGS